MFPLQLLGKIFKVLRSNQTPPQIAGGFILGMIIGLVPHFNLIHITLILLIIIINVNIASAILSFGIFTTFAYIFDPLFNSFGYQILVGIQALENVWISMYNAPVIPFSRFYNTMVMGTLLASLILIFPMYVAVKKFVVYYRVKINPKIQNQKWVKAIQRSFLYDWYMRIRSLGE